jgi:hypothetical protein
MQTTYETQEKGVLAYLNTGKAITPIQALNLFGCFRLAAVIFRLRDKGLNIETRTIRQGRKSYASYKLIKE